MFGLLQKFNKIKLGDGTFYLALFLFFLLETNVLLKPKKKKYILIHLSIELSYYMIDEVNLSLGNDIYTYTGHKTI